MRSYVRLLMLGGLIVGMLAACAQPTPETVEVTRVVTEQEEVEVTRVVTEEEQVEVTREVVREPEVVITFWTTDNEAERVTRYEEVAERFMEEHPEIEVRIVPIEEAGVSQRMATALAAQRPPDLIRMGVERIAAFAADEILDEEAATTVIQNVGEDDFRDGPLQMVTNPETGNYAGIPYDGWIQAIWYRQDLFDQAGLPAPVSWDDINQVCDALPDMEELQYAITLGTDPGQNYGHQIFEQVAISNDA
ncbi:MAG: carbohydrate ABC transporter substrate-binding protein, partial [Anaerolineae bacterium]|nr:carbohydrate ABC transporter substrate-binding protein [Anaerolineae bacterium]